MPAFPVRICRQIRCAYSVRGRDLGERVACLGQGRGDLVLDGTPRDGAAEMQDDHAVFVDEEGLGHGHDAPVEPIARAVVAADGIVGIAQLRQEGQRLVHPVVVVHSVKRHARFRECSQDRVFHAAGRAPGGEEIYGDEALALKHVAGQEGLVGQRVEIETRGRVALLDGSERGGVHALLQGELVVLKLPEPYAAHREKDREGQDHQPVEFHELFPRRASTSSSLARVRRAFQIDRITIATSGTRVTT
jgi:hypothetical protein